MKISYTCLNVSEEKRENQDTKENAELEIDQLNVSPASYDHLKQIQPRGKSPRHSTKYTEFATKSTRPLIEQTESVPKSLRSNLNNTESRKKSHEPYQSNINNKKVYRETKKKSIKPSQMISINADDDENESKFRHPRNNVKVNNIPQDFKQEISKFQKATDILKHPKKKRNFLKEHLKKKNKLKRVKLHTTSRPLIDSDENNQEEEEEEEEEETEEKQEKIHKVTIKKKRPFKNITKSDTTSEPYRTMKKGNHEAKSDVSNPFIFNLNKKPLTWKEDVERLNPASHFDQNNQKEVKTRDVNVILRTGNRNPKIVIRRYKPFYNIIGYPVVHQHPLGLKNQRKYRRKHRRQKKIRRPHDVGTFSSLSSLATNQVECNDRQPTQDSADVHSASQFGSSSVPSQNSNFHSFSSFQSPLISNFHSSEASNFHSFPTSNFHSSPTSNFRSSPTSNFHSSPLSSFYSSPTSSSLNDYFHEKIPLYSHSVSNPANLQYEYEQKPSESFAEIKLTTESPYMIQLTTEETQSYKTEEIIDEDIPEEPEEQEAPILTGYDIHEHLNTEELAALHKKETDDSIEADDAQQFENADDGGDVDANSEKGEADIDANAESGALEYENDEAESDLHWDGNFGQKSGLKVKNDSW